MCSACKFYISRDRLELFHEPVVGSSKSQTPNPKKAPITKFQMASSPRPAHPAPSESGQVSEREKTTTAAVHGSNARFLNVEAANEQRSNRLSSAAFFACVRTHRSVPWPYAARLWNSDSPSKKLISKLLVTKHLPTEFLSNLPRPARVRAYVGCYKIVDFR